MKHKNVNFFLYYKNIGFSISETKGSSSVFDMLANLSMFCYDIVINLIHEKLNICIEAYMVEMGKKSTLRLKMEDRLGWLIQLMAAVLKTKTLHPAGFSTSDPKEIEIYVKILKLMNYTTTMFQQNYFASMYLELAYIAFCDGFQKEVIANPKQVTYSVDSEFDSISDTYSALENALNVTSIYQIVDILIQKMIVNLQVYTAKHDLVELTLENMKQLVTNSSTSKKIIQLESVQSLFKNHAVNMSLNNLIEYY